MWLWCEHMYCNHDAVKHRTRTGDCRTDQTGRVQTTEDDQFPQIARGRYYQCWRADIDHTRNYTVFSITVRSFRVSYGHTYTQHTYTW